MKLRSGVLHWMLFEALTFELMPGNSRISSIGASNLPMGRSGRRQLARYELLENSNSTTKSSSSQRIKMHLPSPNWFIMSNNLNISDIGASPL